MITGANRSINAQGRIGWGVVQQRHNRMTRARERKNQGRYRGAEHRGFGGKRRNEPNKEGPGGVSKGISGKK